MTDTDASETRHIRIKTLVHEKTGLLIASSEDLPGLLVHGRNADELTQRLPVAIQALLEASGKVVVSLSPEAPQARGFKSLSGPSYDAEVRLVA